MDEEKDIFTPLSSNKNYISFDCECNPQVTAPDTFSPIDFHNLLQQWQISLEMMALFRSCTYFSITSFLSNALYSVLCFLQQSKRESFGLYQTLVWSVA